MGVQGNVVNGLIHTDREIQGLQPVNTIHLSHYYHLASTGRTSPTPRHFSG